MKIFYRVSGILYAITAMISPIMALVSDNMDPRVIALIAISSFTPLLFLIVSFIAKDKYTEPIALSFLMSSIICGNLIVFLGSNNWLLFMPYSFGLLMVIFLDFHYEVFIKHSSKFIVFALIFSVIGVGSIRVSSMNYQKKCMNREYKSIKINQDILKAQIRVTGETEEDRIIFSAVVIDKDDDTYYALTANHCVTEESSPIKYHTDIDDKSCDVKVVKKDRHRELALLSFTTKDIIEPIELSSMDPIYTEKIVSIGNPSEKDDMTTYGEITSIQAKGLATYNVNKVFLHNAYIKEGSSGGAVLSSRGQLLGISIASNNNMFNEFRSAYAILVSEIEKFLDKE